MDIEAAKASARKASARRTCEGCAWLERRIRPRCMSEKSPHFRTARDAYHERCAVFAVRIDAPPKPAEPPPKPAPVSRPKWTGDSRTARQMIADANRLLRQKQVRKPTDAEHAAVMERNQSRKVGA
jgi:hypothetical protein